MWVRALVAVVVLAARLAGAAQMNTAELAGIVRDAQGAVLPGTDVVAVHVGTGARFERRADAEGRFRLAALPVGDYTITASRPGFLRLVESHVALSLGQQLELELILHAGELSEELTVSADAPLIQTTTAEISDIIDRQTVIDMPLNGRNFLALAQLSDAVVLPPGGTRGDALQQAGPLPNVGGQRSGHNIYLLDGVKVTDELFNNLVINPSVDAVQEFKIQKSQYAAEFGGKASALINVATRGGANTFHGSLFEFGRHERLDARGYFDPAESPQPVLRQHQFGGTWGGPLIRQRMFFFGSYEGQRLRRGQTRTFSVPSEQARRGDLGAVQIQATAIDPVARALLAHVPLPNRPGEFQNLVAIGEQRRQTDQVSLRLDHSLGDGGQLLARVSTFRADERQPFGTSVLQESLLPGFGRRVDTRASNAAISHTRAFSTAVLHELRVGWLRVGGGQRNANAGVPFADEVGLQGVTRDPRDQGFPQVSTRGVYSTFGDSATTILRQNEHVELFDNLLLDRGRHRMKFGAYVFHLRFRPEQPDNARGVFSYTGQFTGHPFGDFLSGFPASATGGVGRGDQDGRTTWLHAFVQDDWRVRDNLTLNLGLRYEYNRHMRDENNRLSSVDWDSATPRFVIASGPTGELHPDAAALLPSMPLPYVSSAEAGWERGLLRPSRVRLAPRTGFAWSLADSKAVVRGGYGIFLNQWAYSVQTAFSRNLPFFSTRQVDVPLGQQVPAFGTRDILTADPTGVVSPTIMDHAYAVEYTQTWSAGVQYEAWPAAMLEAGYMGSWTLGADNATVRNVPEPGPGPIQPRRPIPQLGAIRAIRFDGKSIYHGLTLKLEQRLRRSHAYSVSYTLSRSIDDASSPGATEAEANVPQNVRNIFDESGEWARSSFDRRHLLAASATYLLPSPSARGGLWSLLRDWRVTAIVLAQSGAPFTVNLGVDRANIGGGPAQRPDQIADANLPGGQRTATRWFDTDAFTLPALYSFGSARRNSVVGPGYATMDLSVAKGWSFGARRMELRWEVYNALNRANLDLPNRIFGTPNFGRVFSARPAREMQLAARFSF
jgi:hypothetical protein